MVLFFLYPLCVYFLAKLKEIMKSKEKEGKKKSSCFFVNEEILFVFVLRQKYNNKLFV